MAYTFQRLLDPALGSSVSATLHFLDRVVAVDEQIVEFQLKTPNVILPSTLANFFFSIVPHDRTSEQLSQQSAGSGPFQLAEQVPGERAVLKRNPQYWHPEQPYLDEVQLLTITEATSQIAALTSGTVDMVAQVGLEQLPVLEPNAEIKLIENQGLAHLFVMRVTDKPFDDVRVRQAFKHAVDRPALQQLILQGHGQPGNDQPVSPHSPYWANVPPLAYDIEKAKQLLADAGYADGVAVTLTVTDLTPRIVDAAVALQEMVKPAGINITLEKTSMDVYLSEKYGQTPFYVDWVPLPLEPDNVLTLSFGREAPFNLSGWSDDRVDELVNNARQEREPAKRKQMYGEVQQRISQEGAVLIPYFAPGWIATRTHVQGIIPSNFIRAESIWLSPNN